MIILVHTLNRQTSQITMSSLITFVCVSWDKDNKNDGNISIR